MNYVTSGEAANILGITTGRVRQLLLNGTLKGKHFGHVWMLDRRSVDRFAATRRTGRPPLDKA